MTNEIPTNSPEKVVGLDDNARKFIVSPLDDSFFDDKSVTSFDLIVDWLETNEVSEKKLAHKIFDDGTEQILLISKATQTDGSRKTVKQQLTEEQYRELSKDSVLHLEKNRREFTVIQGGVSYDVKYDVFSDGALHMLEVDSKNDEDRDSFDVNSFPGKLDEVTGNMDYYGYRVSKML